MHVHMAVSVGWDKCGTMEGGGGGGGGEGNGGTRAAPLLGLILRHAHIAACPAAVGRRVVGDSGIAEPVLAADELLWHDREVRRAARHEARALNGANDVTVLVNGPRLRVDCEAKHLRHVLHEALGEPLADIQRLKPAPQTRL